MLFQFILTFCLCWNLWISLTSDYKCRSQTFGNKTTALLPSWANLFQNNCSKLIWPPPTHTYPNTRPPHTHAQRQHMHILAAVGQWWPAGISNGRKWVSACSSLIPVYGSSAAALPPPCVWQSHSIHFYLCSPGITASCALRVQNIKTSV